jgi:heat shock protein HtpX
LTKLERYQGQFWEDLMFPVPARRVPQPSLLRTHPTTEERVARLRMLERTSQVGPISVVEEPMVSLVGFSPAEMRPRYRPMGLWY